MSVPRGRNPDGGNSQMSSVGSRYVMALILSLQYVHELKEVLFGKKRMALIKWTCGIAETPKCTRNIPKFAIMTEPPSMYPTS